MALMLMSLVLNRRTVRSAEKGKAVRERYIGLGDKFDIAVVEDLVTGDLTEALKGILHLDHWHSIRLSVHGQTLTLSSMLLRLLLAV